MSGRRSVLVGDRFGPVRFGPISAEHVRAFAEVSGDRNAIHLDPSAARRIGLATTPVPGMQLVALMHAAVQERMQDLEVTAISTRFLAPVPVGGEVEISGRVVKTDEADGRVRAILRIFLKTGDGQLASLGEATLLATTAGLALP